MEAFLLLLSQTTLGFYGLLSAFQKRVPTLLLTSLLVITLFGLLGVIVTRSLEAHYFALTNMYESLISLVFGLLLSWVWVGRQDKASPGVSVLQILLAALGLLALWFAQQLPHSIEPLQPALASYWRSIHVPIVILSYSLFTLAFLGSVGYFVTAGWSSDDLTEGSAAATFHSIAARSIQLGFPLLTIGIVLGAMWAHESWGIYWNWDPKESMSLATLLGYGVYLHLNFMHGSHPRLLNCISVAAYLLLLMTYIGVNVMGVGLHSYGNYTLT